MWHAFNGYVVMTKVVALLSFVALLCHAMFFREPTLSSANTSMALAGLFLVCALMAVREWFDEMIDA